MCEFAAGMLCVDVKRQVAEEAGMKLWEIVLIGGGGEKELGEVCEEDVTLLLRLYQRAPGDDHVSAVVPDCNADYLIRFAMFREVDGPSHMLNVAVAAEGRRVDRVLVEREVDGRAFYEFWFMANNVLLQAYFGFGALHCTNAPLHLPDFCATPPLRLAAAPMCCACGMGVGAVMEAGSYAYHREGCGRFSEEPLAITCIS